MTLIPRGRGLPSSLARLARFEEGGITRNCSALHFCFVYHETRSLFQVP